MNFALSDEQEFLKEAARGALSRVKTVEAAYPGVHIYTPVVDAYLNAKKFIVPGLGDFGDRLYGT